MGWLPSVRPGPTQPTPAQPPQGPPSHNPPRWLARERPGGVGVRGGSGWVSQTRLTQLRAPGEGRGIRTLPRRGGSEGPGYRPRAATLEGGRVRPVLQPRVGLEAGRGVTPLVLASSRCPWASQAPPLLPARPRGAGRIGGGSEQAANPLPCSRAVGSASSFCTHPLLKGWAKQPGYNTHPCSRGCVRCSRLHAIPPDLSKRRVPPDPCSRGRG